MSRKPCLKSNSEEQASKRLPRGNTPTQSRGRATLSPRDSFQVVIQCESEDQQERLYHEFRSRNLTVRLLTM